MRPSSGSFSPVGWHAHIQGINQTSILSPYKLYIFDPIYITMKSINEGAHRLVWLFISYSYRGETA